MTKKQPASGNSWGWVPSLYFAEGIPYVVVMTVSIIMYKRLGISNTDIALYTSWLYLPWVIKPLWSPFVDIFKTKRFWIVTMQLIIGAGFAGVALTIPAPNYFQYSLAVFWLLAFSSATHDISADGFYMLGLSEHDQAFFVGIRSTFYRIAMIFGQGVLIILAGYIETHSGLPSRDINVIANPSFTVNRVVFPQQFDTTQLAGPVKIITYPGTLQLSTASISQATADSLIKRVKNWNTKNLFYADKQTGTIQASTAPGESSWWDKNVVAGLEWFLKTYFGPGSIVKVNSSKSGNVGVVFFHLSKKPAGKQQVIVNFGRESGDHSISLVEGSRFVFTSLNWNKPAAAIIQLDPKLKTSAAALFIVKSGNIKLSWIVTFFFLSAIFISIFVYHKFILPYPSSDKPVVQKKSFKNILSEFLRTFVLFFKKNNIGVILSFILLYRLGEAQLVKMAAPFMLDSQEVGGLALTTGQIGFIYGTIGLIALTLGGILGGIVAAKHGLKYWVWWMLAAINIPDLVYVYLSYTQTSNLLLINIAVAFEQFGYGFGFTAYMLVLILISEGDHKTSHYALATGFMALGMMIPGMFSGWLQSIIGYRHFFIWVCISTIPIFIITKFIKIDPAFGKKTNQPPAENF